MGQIIQLQWFPNSLQSWKGLWTQCCLLLSFVLQMALYHPEDFASIPLPSLFLPPVITSNQML